MSSSYGAVVKRNKVVGYFKFDGTNDFAISTIWGTLDEVAQHWREIVVNFCKCGEASEAVTLYTSQGGGFHWPAKACFKCRAITENCFPYEATPHLTQEGKPSGLEISLPDEH